MPRASAHANDYVVPLCVVCHQPTQVNASFGASLELRSAALSMLNISVVRCSAGYGDFACSTCLSGYFRLDDSCNECPSAAYKLVVMYTLAICA